MSSFRLYKDSIVLEEAARVEGDDDVASVRQLGSAELHDPCEEVRAEEARSEGVQRDVAKLKEALRAFRAQHGFGRAIAGPQLGIHRAIIAMDLSSTPALAEGAPRPSPMALLSPRIVRASDERFRLWDDCFSFPDLLVLVERRARVVVDFLDEHGERVTWHVADPRVSELLQHEIDHLDGILAVQRARPIPDGAPRGAGLSLDSVRAVASEDIAQRLGGRELEHRCIISRELYLRDRAAWDALADVPPVDAGRDEDEARGEDLGAHGKRGVPLDM
jgi:peptide deformylase